MILVPLILKFWVEVGDFRSPPAPLVKGGEEFKSPFTRGI
jgi:hypothetical protein